MFLSRLNESRYTTLILASIFAFTLFLQCCFFHYQAFHSILISSLWNDPIDFFLFYLPKISISIIIAAAILLLNNKYFTMVCCILLTLWCFVDLIYIRANNIPIDAYCFTMVGNMDGFWESILLLIYPSDVILLLPCIIFLITICFFKKKVLNLYKCIIPLLTLGFCLDMTSAMLNRNKFKNQHEEYLSKLITETGDDIFPPGANNQTFINFYTPFDADMVRSLYGDMNRYISDYSIYHILIYNLIDVINANDDLNSLNYENLSHFLSLDGKMMRDSTNDKLIILLIESLENWVITPEIMPNLYSLTKSNNILYAPRITSQALKGTSADGQMIVLTGLLPIKNGATCFRYSDNTYPSIVKNFPKKSSCGLFPHELSVWNQDKMSRTYQIADNYVISEEDTIIVKEILNKKDKYACILSITSSTHSPFNKIAKRSSYITPNDMPLHLSNYIKSFNEFDKCIGTLIDEITINNLMNYTIVITGDHTIFHTSLRNELNTYSIYNNLNLNIEENYCPLIIYSPNIEEKTVVEEVVYQMDIYPTILHVIGAEDYYWKGFGVNLLDSVARKNRPISPEEAFELSDKLIRANYFKQIEDSLYSTIK